MEGVLIYQLSQTYDTLLYKLVLGLIWKDSGLSWESNPRPSQLQCDCSIIELPSPWEQGGGELGIPGDASGYMYFSYCVY